jgi:hypothetical protein
MNPNVEQLKYPVEVETPYDNLMDVGAALCNIPFVKDVKLVNGDVNFKDIFGTLKRGLDGLQYQTFNIHSTKYYNMDLTQDTDSPDKLNASKQLALWFVSRSKQHKMKCTVGRLSQLSTSISHPSLGSVLLKKLNSLNKSLTVIYNISITQHSMTISLKMLIISKENSASYNSLSIALLNASIKLWKLLFTT